MLVSSGSETCRIRSLDRCVARCQFRDVGAMSMILSVVADREGRLRVDCESAETYPG
jgi:hypothetical protein